MNRDTLEKLSRNELIARASSIGVPRAEVMTRMELVDEIVRRSITDEHQRRRARGWLGVARDLVASLIDQGLNMGDTADLVRGGGVRTTPLRHQPPVATVTLAEIYASQGHTKRALTMLDEVLVKEPDHQFASSLRDRLLQAKRPPADAPLEPDVEDASVEPPEAEDVEEASAGLAQVAEEASAGLAQVAEEASAGLAQVAEEASAEPAGEATAEPENVESVSLDGAEPAGEATAGAPEVAEAALPVLESVPAETQDEFADEVDTPVQPAVAVDGPAAFDPPTPLEAIRGAEPLAPPPLVVHEVDAAPALAVTPFVPNADVLLVRRASATRVSVYWELLPAHTLEAVVRLVAFVPEWRGPSRVERQVAADSAVGHASLEVPDGAEVRAVVGTSLGGAFRPLAIGVEIQGDREPEVSWAPSPVFRERVVPALGRAFEAMQRG
ncbi:MAG: hypothetical protein R3B13_25805 [Polyangiaceae bacterium]